MREETRADRQKEPKASWERETLLLSHGVWSPVVGPLVGWAASPLKLCVIYEIICIHQNETMHFSSNFKLHKAETK